MLELKNESDYLTTKKDLEKLPIQIILTWLIGIIVLIIGLIEYYRTAPACVYRPSSLWIIGFLLIIIFCFAIFLMYLRYRLGVKIEIWEKKQKNNK